VRSQGSSLLPLSARDFRSVSAGLFVGVRDYEDPALHPVLYAADDAVDFAHQFSIALQLIDPKKTVLLISGEPQKAESRDRLRVLVAAGVALDQPSVGAVYHHAIELGRLTESNGLLVATFASHGFTEGGTSVLAMAGTRKRRPVLSGLRMDAVFDDLSQSHALKRLALIDACRERFEGKTRSHRCFQEPLGDAFHRAMSKTQGFAILAGTGRGGYCYDDDERKNGVFSASVIDGLRGEAPGDANALITVGSVAGFADARVSDWVLRNRPSHRQQSLGITAIYDPESMRDLPLAINPRAVRIWLEKRRNEALSKLIQYLGPRDQMYLAVEEILNVDLPDTLHYELLEEIYEFDGSRRSRHALLGFLAEARGFGGNISQGASRNSNRESALFSHPELTNWQRSISHSGCPQRKPKVLFRR
jgi:hypothetical protein